MALKDKATFTAAIVAAAAQLTAAWKDTVLTEVAPEIRRPDHPLRRIDKLMDLNPSTGVVTADTDYIDEAYDGRTPKKGSSFDAITDVAFALVSAVVENAAPNQIVLLFDYNVTAADVFNVLPAKTVTNLAIAGSVVTATVSSPFVNGDVISFWGSFSSGTSQVDLEGQAVVNNVL